MSSSGTADSARRVAFESVAAEVYEPLQRYLRRRCAEAEVDEVLNDTLLTVWRRLDDVPKGKVLPWTYGVARRCLANHRRGAMRRLALADKAVAAATGPADDWTSSADARLHDAMGRLGDDDREVLRLWAWERLEPREIAVVFETSPNAISLRLRKIRRRLEEEISGQNRAPAGHEESDGHSKGER